jgi:ACS family hexuronate transporter-like MFS transporter
LSPHQDSPALRRIRFSLSHRRRWLIVGLISLVALINYFDRQSLSIVATRFQAELHLSDEGYGHVVSLFLLASAFSYAGAGLLTDWLGTRVSMALFVGWWSIAEAMTAFVRSATQLAAARFCLGLGEPGLWVAAPKAVGETLDEKHHSLAIGIYTLGATVGAVLALPAIAAVTTHLPWKSIFVIDGCAGILWLPLWFSAFPKERQAIAESCAAAPAVSYRAALKDVLTRSKTWKLMIARGITDPVWFFYLFWYPKYLLGARGLPLARVAQIGWMVYLFAGAGTLIGGVVAGLLIRRGLAPALAYRRSMLVYAALIPLSPLAGLAPSALISVSIASVIALAHMAWLITLSSTIIAVFPPAQLGKAFGLIAAGSAFGGLLSTELVANVVTHHGYLPLFFLMMFLHPLALALLWTTFKEKPTAAPAVA